MTDTIGWGDVDVDDAPRSRRRLPRAIIWVVVAAVVAGVGIWPAAKDTLAERAATWLQRQWVTAVAYESSRSDLELASSQRLAAGDTPTMVAIVQSLDREEAGKLTAMASAIGRHRSWKASVGAAATAVRRAFVAEARDLRADVTVAPKVLPTSIYVENPYSSGTDVLVERAATQMSRLAHSQHLKTKTSSKATLTSAAGLVAALNRLTAVPVDMRLAITDGDQLDLWDLRTGRVRRAVLNLPVNPPTGVLSVAGSSLLAQVESGWQLWPTSGARPVDLPATADTTYQPDNRGGVWRTDQGRIRRYDAAGRPAGPSHPYPDNTEVGYAATSNAIVTNIGPENFNRPRPVLWYPDTGRLVPFEDPCPGTYVTTTWTVAITSCDGSRVTLLDTRTGRSRVVGLPHGMTIPGGLPVLSRDGTRMAVQAAPSNNVEGPTTLLVFDVTKPGVTRVATSAAPMTWSADGSTLLLDIDGTNPSSPVPSADVTAALYSPLAYWQPGMKDVAGIRLNLSINSFAIAAIP